jgi:hypothetical protein
MLLTAVASRENSTWFTSDYGPTYNPLDWPTLLTVELEPMWRDCVKFDDNSSGAMASECYQVYYESTRHQVYCWANNTLRNDSGTTYLRTTDDCYLDEDYVMDGDQTVDANGTYNGTVIDYTDPDVLPWCGEVRPYAILWPLVKWWALKIVKDYELPCWRKPNRVWNETAKEVVGGIKEVVHEKTVWGMYYWCWVTGSVFNTSRWVVFEIQSILLGLANKDVSKWYEYGITIDNERCWVTEEMLRLGKGKFLPHGI